MKPFISLNNINSINPKKHKSSTDIQTVLNKKSLINKNNNVDKQDNKNEDFLICNHKLNLISFCEICSLDLCPDCEEKHINHKIIKFYDIIPNKEEINEINNAIKKYCDEYNRLIEEIYKWKKELDKKIFYFEEQIKNNSIINKNIEYIKNFDFYNNNNYSSLIRYKTISHMIIKPFKNDFVINNDINIGCYMYNKYMNIKQILNKIIQYKNDDFIVKSNDIVHLIFEFLSSNKKQNDYNCNNNEKEKNLSEVNNINEIKMFENDNYFKNEHIYNNNTYTFSNTSKKKENNNINEININYLNNTINEKDLNETNDKKNEIKNIPIHKSNNSEKQSKSIGNIFLEEQKVSINEKNSNTNYMKLKKGIIKSSTLRRLNIINTRNNNGYHCKEIYFNQKNQNINETNSVNNISDILNKNLTTDCSFNNNKNDEIHKYIPKIKTQNRVFIVNNNTNTNLNTINSYNNIKGDKNSNKKKVYRHKKLNSISISSYINQSLPNAYNNSNNNLDLDNLETFNNTSENNKNLIKPLNIDAIKNTYTALDKKNVGAYNPIFSPIYSLNSLDTNITPSSYYSIKESNNNHLLNNKKNDIKKKFYSKNSNQNNYNTIIETPITFSSKLNSENNTLKYNKTSNNIKPHNIIEKNNENKDIYLIDSTKNLYIGLELGNSKSRIGIINQNNSSEVELFNFGFINKDNTNKYTIPTIISFDSKSNDIKIGNEAKDNIINNPSQTIFNILKIIGKSYKQINNDIDLWPFKLYYNEDLCRPYIKINFNKQKNRIFFFEDLLSIYLKKLFEIFFGKIKLINSNSNIINLILVVTVPNNYNYLQRKIVEKIFQTQIFPQTKNSSNQNNNIKDNINNNSIDNKKNNKNKINLFSGYKIILKDIKIENGTSMAALCLFNNKIRAKNNIENIFNDISDNYNCNDNNNKQYQINILNNNDDKTYSNIISDLNKDYFSTNPNTIDVKERHSINSSNKNKNILIINIDGGFTNISLANISQNKPKEKINSKIKNNKNVKKNNLNNINILEIIELSGYEFGEEDFIDIYINDCLKQYDESIYKECLKSPTELARLRQSILIAKKYFNSSQKDNSISISLPHKFLDLKINLNQNDYEKSCQELYTKIITIIQNILKKSKLSEKNIDIIILLASKVTKNKIFSMIKNIFTNSKIIYNNCNDYIVIGATMQALNNSMIKPFYKYIDIINMNFGIETLNGIMDIIVPKGLKLPVQIIKYVKIKNNDNNDGENNNHLNKYLEINIFEGDNKFVKNNRLISCANIDKRNFKEEKMGEGFIELLVEFEINYYSSLSVYVLDIKNFKRRFECLTNLDMVKG